MSQDQIQLPEPVGTVAPRPDVVDWFSYEPEIGTELHEAATVRRLIAEAVAAERERATGEANRRANASWSLMATKMVEAEREACAKACDEAKAKSRNHLFRSGLSIAAGVIRSRSAAKSAGELPPTDRSPQVQAPERLHPLHDPGSDAGLVSGGVPFGVPPTGMEHQGNDASPGHKFHGCGQAGGSGVSGGLEAGRSGHGGVAREG